MIAVFFASTAVWADQQVNVHVPGGGAQDMLNMTTVPAEISDTGGNTSDQRYCTNPSGRFIRKGQDGYENCLALARGKKPTVIPTATSDQGIVIQSK